MVLIMARRSPRSGRPRIRSPRHHLFVLLLLLILACTTTAGAADVHRASTVRDQYFDVSGASADTVFASIARKKLGPEPGRGASGLTESSFRYSLEMEAPDLEVCRVTSLVLNLDIVVTLPRHRAPHSLSADDKRNWEIYATAVELHEYRHVEIALRGLEEVAARIERGLTAGRIQGSGKKSCKKYINQLLAEQRETTKRRHADFHREDSRVVRGLRRNAREAIDKLDAELAKLTAAIDALDTVIAAAQTDQLHAPAGELLAEIHAAIEARNGLLPEHRTLVADRNRRAKDLAWIR